MQDTLLIVDHHSQLGAQAPMLGQALHCQIRTVEDPQAALEWITGNNNVPRLEMVLWDISSFPERHIEAIRNVKALRPALPIVVLTPYGNEADAAAAMAAGASEFVTKPVSLIRLKFSLQQVIKQQRMSNYITWLERKFAGHMDFSDIVGESAPFRQALEAAREAALSKLPVWLEGEMGSGKELFARAIHGGSARAGKPFVTLNCEAVPEALAEGILFGQESAAPFGKGNFSLGKLREADQGTLFLEEPAALSPQVKQRLLSVLESGQMTPLGGKNPLRADVRLICATTRPEQYQATGADYISGHLYARCKSLSITLPPLHSRKGDVWLLAEHFLALYSASENKYIRPFAESALQWLDNHPWPGNVAQLAHTIWRAVVLCEGEEITLEDLRALQQNKLSRGNNRAKDAFTTNALLTDEQGRLKPLKSVEEQAIRFALQHAGGCMTRAAKNLGIGRSTLYRKVSEMAIDPYISRANHTMRPMMKISSMERS